MWNASASLCAHKLYRKRFALHKNFNIAKKIIKKQSTKQRERKKKQTDRRITLYFQTSNRNAIFIYIIFSNKNVYFHWVFSCVNAKNIHYLYVSFPLSRFWNARNVMMCTCTQCDFLYSYIAEKHIELNSPTFWNARKCLIMNIWLYYMYNNMYTICSIWLHIMNKIWTVLAHDIEGADVLVKILTLHQNCLLVSLSPCLHSYEWVNKTNEK